MERLTKTEGPRRPLTCRWQQRLQAAVKVIGLAAAASLSKGRLAMHSSIIQAARDQSPDSAGNTSSCLDLLRISPAATNGVGFGEGEREEAVEGKTIRCGRVEMKQPRVPRTHAGVSAATARWRGGHRFSRRVRIGALNEGGVRGHSTAAVSGGSAAAAAAQRYGVGCERWPGRSIRGLGSQLLCGSVRWSGAGQRSRCGAG